VLVLGAIACYAYGYVTAQKRVASACGSIQPGTPLVELAAFAKSHGLTEPQVSSGRAYLVEERTFGRYGCRVDLVGGRVKSSTYSYAN
jgi:hypothetical protein